MHIITSPNTQLEKNAKALGRVLIVEDESIVALDISNQLRHHGYIVVGIMAHGDAAISAVPTLQPDLIVMGIRLKGTLDGIQAAQNIRLNSHVPIIFLSAYADPKTLQRIADIETSSYLIKPFKDTELLEITKNAIHNESHK